MLFYYLFIGIPCLSLISVAMYGLDKRQALPQAQRIPESTLLSFDLLGGWPGGLWAQRKFRHKTIKRSFRVKFGLAIVCNLMWIGWLTFNEMRAF